MLYFFVGFLVGFITSMLGPKFIRFLIYKSPNDLLVSKAIKRVVEHQN